MCNKEFYYKTYLMKAEHLYRVSCCTGCFISLCEPFCHDAIQPDPVCTVCNIFL